MINYNKNKLLDEALDRYYTTFSHTLDTADYVPQKFNDKILKYIFKCMRKKFREIDVEDRIFQRQLKLEERQKQAAENRKSKQAKRHAKKKKFAKKHRKIGAKKSSAVNGANV